MITIKLHYLYLLIIFGIATNFCNAQNTNNVIVFEVKYFNSKYQVGSIAYSLIEIDSLKNFKIDGDNINNPPNIVYEITKNGGIYISYSPSYDLFVYGCCEYNDVNKGVQLYINGKVSKDKLKEYSNQNNFSVYNFDNKNGYCFLYKKNGEMYKIKAWLVNLDYCTCDIYMENPQQKIFGKKAAYIRKIYSIKKPDKRLRKKIKVILQEIINSTILNTTSL